MKRVHLVDSNGVLDIGMIRRASIALSDFFCNSDIGYDVGDPIFEYVTEGRQSNHDKILAMKLVKGPYSACGDLVNTVIFHLGVRDETLVNKTNDGGNHPWVIGANLSMIQAHKYWKVFNGKNSIPEGGDWPQMGEPFMTGFDSHIAILESLDFDLGILTSYDYGQVNMNTGKAHGVRKTRKLYMENNQMIVESMNGQKKHCIGFLPLDALDYSVSAIVPDSFDEGVLDESNPEPHMPLLAGLRKTGFTY